MTFYERDNCGAERNVTWTSVSSLITCVQLNLTKITVHFNYEVKRWLYILRLLSMSDGQLDDVSKLNERASA